LLVALLGSAWHALADGLQGARECVAGLKGSIGDRSNHSNFSHQNSVNILSEQAPFGTASQSSAARQRGLKGRAVHYLSTLQQASRDNDKFMIHSSKDEAFLFVNVRSGSDTFGSEWF
jgi:hypothetical protein